MKSLLITLRHSHRIVVEFESEELRSEAMRILRRDLIRREQWFAFGRSTVWTVSSAGKKTCVVLVRDVVAVSLV